MILPATKSRPILGETTRSPNLEAKDLEFDDFADDDPQTGTEMNPFVFILIEIST